MNSFYHFCWKYFFSESVLSMVQIEIICYKFTKPQQSSLLDFYVSVNISENQKSKKNEIKHITKLHMQNSLIFRVR